MRTREMRRFEVPPSAARLTASLRDIGYDFPTAVADLVDNSVAAGATRVDIDIEFDGRDSFVSIADDGAGMTANGLIEAMRYGTRRDYELSEFEARLSPALIGKEVVEITVTTDSPLKFGFLEIR